MLLAANLAAALAFAPTALHVPHANSAAASVKMSASVDMQATQTRRAAILGLAVAGISAFSPERAAAAEAKAFWETRGTKPAKVFPKCATPLKPCNAGAGIKWSGKK